MRIGVRQGARGADVGRLQRVLRSSGFAMDPGELSREEFGPSTLGALHALLRRRNLPLVDEIDSRTLEVLVEIEQNITINVEEGARPSPAPTTDRTPGKVSGTLVDGDGAPTVSTRVACSPSSCDPRGSSARPRRTRGGSTASPIAVRRR